MEQVTYQQLYALKEEYAYHKIIYIGFEGREFVFRSLGREEYNQIISIVREPKDIEDVIAQTALIYPEDYDMATGPLAGLPPYVADVVMKASDVTDMDSLLGLLSVSQDIANRFDFQCMTVIKAAMPEYHFEEMQKWTWERIMFYTALAQKILNLTLPEDAKIDLVDQRQELTAPEEPDPNEEKKFIRSLREQGGDPMFYFHDSGTIRHNLIDDPLLGGRHWENEGVLNEIRQTIHERRHRRHGARR